MSRNEFDGVRVDLELEPRANNLHGFCTFISTMFMRRSSANCRVAPYAEREKMHQSWAFCWWAL